jgi:hypothetical protein
MTKNIFSHSLFFAFVFFILDCSAQDKKFLSPHLKLGAEYVLPADLSDTSGTYGLATGQLGFTYPLISKRFSLTNDLDYKSMVVVANVNGTYRLPDFSFIKTQHQLLAANAGASAIYNSGNKNTLIGNLTFGIAEDFKSIQTFQLRITGLAALKHKVSGNFSYIAGLHYSFIYGRGLPLPILGAIIRTGDKGKLKIILPLNISWKYKLNEYDMLTIFLQPEGLQSNFYSANDSLFTGKPDVVRFRQRSFKAGANLKIGVNDRIHFTPELGYLFRRNIAFSEAGLTAKENFFSQKVKGAPYVKVMVRILIGNLKWKRTGDNYLLNDDRLDDYDLDDPTNL